jgi:hypothetical protein
VLTCLGCGAMGRQEGCAGNCVEHRLPLVAAADLVALRDAVAAADRWLARLEPVVRAFADGVGDAAAARAAVTTRRGAGSKAPAGGMGSASSGARAVPALADPAVLAAPPSVVGWWCSRCGNVDMPQPCIGVCVWQPVEWVNLAVYERELEAAERVLRSAWGCRRFLVRAGAVRPRAGQEERNRAALREQARAVLESVKGTA